MILQSVKSEKNYATKCQKYKIRQKVSKVKFEVSNVKKQNNRKNVKMQKNDTT